jgi:hypothetical protein
MLFRTNLPARLLLANPEGLRGEESPYEKEHATGRSQNRVEKSWRADTLEGCENREPTAPDDAVKAL